MNTPKDGEGNMDSRSNLSGLLGRVEEATGADRELDGDLGALLTPGARGGRGCQAGAVIRSGSMTSAAHYTASLDAALGLCERVLPGTGWLCGVKPTGGFMAELFRTRYISGVIPRLAYATAKTPALAVLAATLRALIAQGEAGTAEPLSRSGRK